MNIGIHISHEAAKKIGGIGSVLSGLCNTSLYQEKYSRTLFYGPLFDDHSSPNPERLGKEGSVFFSSLDGIEDEFPALSKLCQEFHIDIVYGKKKLFDEIHPEQSVEVEIILVGIKRLRIDFLNAFKFQLWEQFRFQSDIYNDWDCEQYIRLAVPFLDILTALVQDEEEVTAFSHEYMGIPCCLKLLSKTMKESASTPENERERLPHLPFAVTTLFYAHEVSTVRALVEKLPGHDITFYNLLKLDTVNGKPLEERFGSQKNNYRNEFIKLALYFDRIIAVGDWIKQEYSYLQPRTPEDKITVVYNGVPTNSLSYEKKAASRNRLIDYCSVLFNFKPDVIFTHVTRLVISKGLWRDIRFLEEMDKYFTENNLKGFYILLSTLISTGRHPDDIKSMEREYGWPLLHLNGYPDLTDYEVDVYSAVKIFNAKARSIKGVFINQYGFSQETTGTRIPTGSTFSDLRYGSDAELGFSIYEPFGIAQIETVPFGGTAILSRQCGCSFLLDNCFQDIEQKPFFCIDFAETELKDENMLFNLSSTERTLSENRLFEKYGKEIYEILPKNDPQRLKLFDQAQKHAAKLGWEQNVAAFLDMEKSDKRLFK